MDRPKCTEIMNQFITLKEFISIFYELRPVKLIFCLYFK